MIDLEMVSAIIDVYQKHGWHLRRILITDPADEPRIAGRIDVSDIPIKRSGINAVWFSRTPKDGPAAWEIRYLGDIPFALLECLDENDPEFEPSLSAVEARLGESIIAKKAP